MTTLPMAFPTSDFSFSLFRHSSRVVAMLATGLLLGFSAFGQSPMENGSVKRTVDVIYGRKAGMALTLDVFEPVRKNAAGVIFLVSGGWASSHDDTTMVHVTPENYTPYLRRGYTVFAVVHGSMPRFNVPDIILDVQRAVRFIRHNAAQYGVDPNRLGVLGSSSGGHLALMIATQGWPGTRGIHRSGRSRKQRSSGRGMFLSPNGFSELGSSGCGWRRTRSLVSSVCGVWISFRH